MFQENGSSLMRLGKLAPVVDERTLKLKDYLPAPLQPVEDEVSWITKLEL
jgi:hypothetical protein